MSRIIGVDLGQASDYTAKAFARVVMVPTVESSDRGIWHEAHVQVGKIERPQLKTPYTEIVTALADQVNKLTVADGVAPDVVVDATGCGRPVIDMMRAAGLTPIPVLITGGHETTLSDDGMWRVPKRELVSSLMVAVQTKRFTIASGVPLLGDWQKEAANFKMRLSRAGHDSYEAQRVGEHDDLVLATCLVTWWCARVFPGEFRATPQSREAEAVAARKKKWVTDKQLPWWKRGTK